MTVSRTRLERASEKPMHDEIGKSLRRLVELVESVVDVLQRSFPILDARPTTVSQQSPELRSVRFESSTTASASAVLQEDLITYAEATRLIPTRPTVSTSTISRWCTNGCGGVKLESVFVGARRKTSRQAVQRFLDNCRDGQWKGLHKNNAMDLEKAFAEMGSVVGEPHEDGSMNNFSESFASPKHRGYAKERAAHIGTQNNDSALDDCRSEASFRDEGLESPQSKAKRLRRSRSSASR